MLHAALTYCSACHGSSIMWLCLCGYAVCRCMNHLLYSYRGVAVHPAPGAAEQEKAQQGKTQDVVPQEFEDKKAVKKVVEVAAPQVPAARQQEVVVEGAVKKVVEVVAPQVPAARQEARKAFWYKAIVVAVIVVMVGAGGLRQWHCAV